MTDKSAIIKEAQKFLARGQVDKAIAEWEKLAKESTDANVYNTIGDLYLKKGDRQPAIDSFQKAAKGFRDDGFALKALAIYKKVLNIDPANTDALYAIGELNEEKGLLQDAIKQYLQAADVLAKEGKKDALLKTYSKILSLSPSNIPMRNKVADLFVKEGLLTDAAREYAHIARTFEDKDDINNAKAYFKKALDFHPNNKDALVGLSAIYEKTGDQKQSAELIKKAIELSPDDTELSLKYAQFLVKQESYEEAMKYVTKLVDAEPSNITARKLLGEIYLNEGDKQKAWEAYSMVIDEMVFAERIDEAVDTLKMFADVEPIETRKKLISLYKQKGDFESAFTELVFLGEAFVFAESGMPAEALNCYREALQIHPDDASLKDKITDLERELGTEPAEAAKSGKTTEEILAESDIFLRYGLYEEAKGLLEGLKLRERDNIDVHLKLKSLYLDSGDKEQAVSECLILAELYAHGSVEKKEEALKEAYEINPEDPRLLERSSVPADEEFAPSGFETTTAPTGLSIEDYGEDMSEAEFYVRQGLYNEAKAIYEKLLELFPENQALKAKIADIDLGAAEGFAAEVEPTPEAQMPVEEFAGKPEEGFMEKPAEELAGQPVEEFVVPEAIEAQEAPPEPSLGEDVLDIFEEFKKGLEKELGTEDSETHYNLGIAYKEMGLIDDAIREFQISKKDPKRFVQSINMLGMCYMSKGLYSLAIDSFKEALEKVETRDESYWGVSYDLAEAYEKNEDLKEALDIYTDIYGWNAKFRNVAEKINLMKVMVAKPKEKPVISEKQKIKKERVSYL